MIINREDRIYLWDLWSVWIRGLFINVSILITLIFIGSQFFMKDGINNLSPSKTKFGLGILGGISGIILMNFTIIIPPDNVFVDMRNISILITSIYGGPISTIVTAIMLATFRWVHGGMNIAASIGVASILLVSLISIIISKINIERQEHWILMFLIEVGITSISLSFIINDKEILTSIIFINLIICIISYSFVFILTKQLERTYHLIKGLEEKSTHDFLTGLMNVRAFDDVFNDIIEEVKRDKDRKLAVLMIDIDYFKKVNDTYGHSVGDIVLSEVGRVILESVRSSDIVARVGGEEFCVILQKSSVTLTLDIAERIRKAVERHKFLINETETISVTISIGASIYPDTTREIEMIKEIADNNLYKAKNEGRNRVILD